MISSMVVNGSDQAGISKISSLAIVPCMPRPAQERLGFAVVK